MSSLVYVKEIRPDSFLHFSTKKYADTSEESYALRDFAYDNSPLLTQETSSYSANDIRIMAKRPGNHYIANIPRHTVSRSEIKFWQDEIARQNEKYGIGKKLISDPQNSVQNYNEQLNIKISEQEKELLLKFQRLPLAKQAVVINLIESLLLQ